MISDWSDLQTILLVAEEGTLSGAARRLGVNQTTMSRRLQAIERALDRRVFSRDGDGRFRPNATGQSLVEAARRVQAAIDEASARINETPAPLRIASCEVLATRFGAPALSGWTAASGQPGDLAVRDNLFDLGEEDFEILITPLESAPADMVGRRIGRLRWRLYAARSYLDSHPFAPGANGLDGHQVLQASGSLADIEAYDWLRRLGGMPVFSASSVFSLRDAAENGMGIAMLPESIIGEHSPLVALESALAPPTSDVWMVARRSLAAQPRIRAFLDWAVGFYAGEKDKSDANHPA